jgi:hypothetical protein
MQYRTNSVGRATTTEILLGPECTDLEKLLNSSTVTYTVPVSAPSVCLWCSAVVCSVGYPSGRWINADVVADADGALRADVLHEHRCEPMEEFARRLETPDPWEGWESE